MDEPSTQGTLTVEYGIVLNNSDDILKSESNDTLSKFSNTEIDFDCDVALDSCQEQDSKNRCAPNEHDSIVFSNSPVDKHCRVPDVNLKSANISNPSRNCASEEHKSQTSTEDIKTLSLDIVNNVIESAESVMEDLLDKKNAHNMQKTCLQNDGEEVENKNEECERPIDSDDNLINSITKSRVPENATNINLKKYSNLKTHFQRKSEKQAKDGVELDEDTICGIGFFKPQWLQKWATAKVYLALYSIIGTFHGCYSSYLIGTVTTLEKRFAFKSKISGSIIIAEEFIPLFLGSVVGYYGSKGHRPRMVAVGMFLTAACSFISSLPYFFYGSVQHFNVLNVKNQTGPEFCALDVKDEECGADERPPTLPAVSLLILGSFLKGFGNVFYYVIGLAYMDDNAKKKDAPLFIAVAFAWKLLGPLLGFLMSSRFLKIYENPFEDPGFGTDDPRWIGAWWMGFCVQGILLFIFTIPIALFPRRLPGHKKPDEEEGSSPSKEKWKDIICGLLNALKRIWMNPFFTFLAVYDTMKLFGYFGHIVMLPKYMENQFRLSASDANLLSGATSIACVMVATVLGGLIVWKYTPSVKALLTGMILSEVILCLGYLVLMIPHCQPAEMLHFGSNDDGLILDSLCNQNCDCSTTSFTPFCGPDGKTAYFSPCFAGCIQELNSTITDKERKEFGNCSCVADADRNLGGKITEGFCVDESCWNQALAYICILLVTVTIGNLPIVAHTMLFLRCVHINDKGVALGTLETFICLFGLIPFPITYGALVDSACLIWERSCEETGNCWFYDMEKFNYLLHGASCFFCCISMSCLIVLYFLRSRVKNLYTDAENDHDTLNIKLDTVSGSVTNL